ncbi:MAG: hypothetical protein COB98_00315 [Flavobacteriaceae bacterium]|nr:MAG: hypothetical protein COB98_00315 [Flavobacteriaceae bacterium]
MSKYPTKLGTDPASSAGQDLGGLQSHELVLWRSQQRHSTYRKRVEERPQMVSQIGEDSTLNYVGIQRGCLASLVLNQQESQNYSTYD